MEAKIVFCVCHGPEKGSKYHLEIVQTTFSEINNCYREIFAKINQYRAKIQQTKMLVTYQKFGDWFLFGLVWPYSSNQKNIITVTDLANSCVKYK